MNRRRLGAIKRSSWQHLRIAGGALLLVAGALALFPTLATASTGACGTLPSDNNVYIDCVVPPASAPYTTYTDAQNINLSMGPNSYFSPSDSGDGEITAMECEYTNGQGSPGDPPNANYCDSQTAAGDFPLQVEQGGSFDYAGQNSGDLVTVYAIPDTSLQTASITCSTTQACVWYVGENYNSFTAPHVFSNPFYVSGGVTPTTIAPTSTTTTTASSTTSTSSTTTTTSSSTTSTTSPESSTTTTSTTAAGSTTTTAAGSSTTTAPPSSSSSSSGSSGSDTSGSGSGSSASGSGSVSGSSDQLAFTGQSPLLIWMMALGFLLLVVGTVGRRLASAPAE